MTFLATSNSSRTVLFKPGFADPSVPSVFNKGITVQAGQTELQESLTTQLSDTVLNTDDNIAAIVFSWDGPAHSDSQWHRQ